MILGPSKIGKNKDKEKIFNHKGRLSDLKENTTSLPNKSVNYYRARAHLDNFLSLSDLNQTSKKM